MRLVNRRPDRTVAIFLAALPFVLVLLAYIAGSEARLADTPQDKLLPGFATFGDAISRMAIEADKRTGDILLWKDTVASLTRLIIALSCATLVSLALGILTGLIPYARATLAPFIAIVSMVPPLAVLPILFILLGLGEASKIVLIAVGVAPFMIRDLALKVEEMPAQQIIKAQTLGANSWLIVLRVVMPQMLPRLIDALRLSIGPAFLFLIAAEAIAAESGLGYRIFLVRRYLAMDVILPYVAWITFLAFVMDWLLKKLQAAAFPWFAQARAS